MADRRQTRAAPGAGALAGLLLLSACSFAPDYAPPALSTSLPAAYKETGPWTPAAPADTAPRGAWWTAFGDPALNDLEGRIEKANPDLAAALARYDQARALVSQARASLLPEADYDGHFTRNRQSDQKKTPGSPTYVSDNLVGGEITYEFDLWGRGAQHGESPARPVTGERRRPGRDPPQPAGPVGFGLSVATGHGRGRKRPGRRHRRLSAGAGPDAGALS